MSTIKSSTEHLTLNADGAGKDIKFQANGVEKASISSAGAFTSTSIDATKLTGALPAIDGSALTGVGKVLQVVEATSTTRVVLSTSTYTSISLSGTITPSSTSSKILVIADVAFNVFGGSGWAAGSIRNGTTQVKEFPYFAGWYGLASSARHRQTPTLRHLDSPATTSAVTYNIYCHTNGSTLEFQDGNQVSTILLIEIGA